jgi:cyanophycinase-like exopeptidase
MQVIEANLIAERNSKYVQIPTAAAPEGQASLNYWIELGKQQAKRIGVEPVPIPIANRLDADDDAFAALIEGAGLIYLSGGNPNFLADTLRETKTWMAIHSMWMDGAALAGCSAGAMALADHIPNLRNPLKGQTAGLGILPHIRVLPHFDRMFMRIPDFMQRFLQVPAGVTVVGIDENTAIVGGPYEWEVQGAQSAWVITHGSRTQYQSGSVLVTPKSLNSKFLNY